MNDYFPVLLIFGFIITFAIFVISVLSNSKPHIELEDYSERIHMSEQISTFLDLIERLKKENQELRHRLNNVCGDKPDYHERLSE
jgi:uncharacterized protein YdeI (YjbR/CyaY-like superfamily)